MSCAEINPIPVKAAMARMGFCTPEIRLPLLPISDGPRAELEREMKALGRI